MPHTTYITQGGKYVNFNSAGELWNRVPDEQYFENSDVSPSLPPSVPIVPTPMFLLFGNRQTFNQETEVFGEGNTPFSLVYSDNTIVPLYLPSDWVGFLPDPAGDEGGYYKNMSFLSNKNIVIPTQYNDTNNCYSIFVDISDANNISSVSTDIYISRSKFETLVLGTRDLHSITYPTYVKSNNGIDILLDNGYSGFESTSFVVEKIVDGNNYFWSGDTGPGSSFGYDLYDNALGIGRKMLDPVYFEWEQMVVLDITSWDNGQIFVGFTPNKMVVINANGKYVYSSDDWLTFDYGELNLNGDIIENVWFNDGKIYLKYRDLYQNKSYFGVIDDDLVLTNYYITQDVYYENDGPYNFNSINSINFENSNTYILVDYWAMFKINNLSANNTWEFIPLNTYANTIYQETTNSISYQQATADFIYIGN